MRHQNCGRITKNQGGNSDRVAIGGATVGFTGVFLNWVQIFQSWARKRLVERTQRFGVSNQGTNHLVTVMGVIGMSQHRTWHAPSQALHNYWGQDETDLF
jgi:hypothetical protein